MYKYKCLVDNIFVPEPEYFGNKRGKTWEISPHASKRKRNIYCIYNGTKGNKIYSNSNEELNRNYNIENFFKTNMFHSDGPNTSHSAISYRGHSSHNRKILVIFQCTDA